jgi:hypothetical protein
VIAGIAVISIAFAVQQAWPREVSQSYRSPNTEIHIVEGDLLAQDCNIVIGMSDAFDTEGPDIISQTSVQSQFLTRVYDDDRDALDRDLTSALTRYAPRRTFPPGQRTGKQCAYEIGTVASIRQQRKFYFCLAYTEMSDRHEAQATVDGIWKSLNCLWDEVRSVSNGDTVSIPVIGGGQARISQQLPAQDSIRLITLSYMLASRKTKVTGRLNVVVRPEDVQNLDMLELQAFLRSLRG